MNQESAKAIIKNLLVGQLDGPVAPKLLELYELALVEESQQVVEKHRAEVSRLEGSLNDQRESQREEVQQLREDLDARTAELRELEANYNRTVSDGEGIERDKNAEIEDIRSTHANETESWRDRVNELKDKVIELENVIAAGKTWFDRVFGGKTPSPFSQDRADEVK